MPFLLVRTYRSVCCPSSVLPNDCFCIFEFASACRLDTKIVPMETTSIVVVITRSLTIHRLLKPCPETMIRTLLGTRERFDLVDDQGTRSTSLENFSSG